MTRPGATLLACLVAAWAIETPAQSEDAGATGAGDAVPAGGAGDLQTMQERRAELLREIERLREELAESEARMATSRERIRLLEEDLPKEPQAPLQ